MSRREIEQKLAAAEESIQEAAMRLERTQKRLHELDHERNAVLGEIEIARRAVGDHELEIARSRKALEALAVEEARLALADAVDARDRAIDDAATALETATRLLEQIDVRRNAVAQAHEHLTTLDTAATRPIRHEESDRLNEAWERVVGLVKSRLDVEFERDIVEAAARSNSPGAMNSLPDHLRALAAQRRQELQRAAAQRIHEATAQRTDETKKRNEEAAHTGSDPSAHGEPPATNDTDDAGAAIKA